MEDDAHGGGSDVEEDHSRDTRWRRSGASEAKAQEEDECSEREEQGRVPGHASQQVEESRRMTQTEGGRWKERPEEIGVREQEVVEPEAVTQERTMWG